jgi:hypothetical protein
MARGARRPGTWLGLDGTDPVIQHTDAPAQSSRVGGRQHAQHALQHFTVVPWVRAARLTVIEHVRALVSRSASEILPGLQRRGSSPRTQIGPLEQSDLAQTPGGYTIDNGDPNTGRPPAGQGGSDVPGRLTSHNSRR